ncbi:MAG: hypothetical protein LKF82_05285 [Acinetobacter populi]|jgi:hypothetical protein|nr:hypothetical protein [Acinetobacter populi]MCH4247239.1 hypothetical protein [Acinetobacter populi]
MLGDQLIGSHRLAIFELVKNATEDFVSDKTGTVHNGYFLIHKVPTSK